MNKTFLLLAATFIALNACQFKHSHDKSITEGHDIDEKFQFTAYSGQFELFAEADPFIPGERANVLAHFSILPGFKALEKGTITLELESGGKNIRQTLEKPTRKGIYSFDIIPAAAGRGRMIFEIMNDAGYFEVIVPEVTVFSNREEAVMAAQNMIVSNTNTCVFTKEQSWKVDFCTDYPKIQAFGPVIRTAGIVQPAPGDETIVTAKTGGIVVYSAKAPFEGNEVMRGQTLFSISGSEFADANFVVKYNEAQNNFEKSKADFERSKILVENKIIADKDFLEAKNKYENAKALFENLKENFSSTGQIVKSPINGFIRAINIQNGSYVKEGDQLMVLTQNKTLVIRAEVPQKYASLLGLINTANIHSQINSMTWTLDELNGRVLSYGKATGPESHLIPVHLEIHNDGNFFPGEIVELYLKTVGSTEALTVPNSALIEEQGILFVWVQITPELFEKREVIAGKTDGTVTEITGKLSPSERIITRGAMLVKLAQATGALDAHSGHVH